MKKVFYEIKWALQRLFRGWDDRAAMDISEWLAQVLPEMLEYIIKYSKSYPVDGPIEDSEEDKKAHIMYQKRKLYSLSQRVKDILNNPVLEVKYIWGNETKTSIFSGLTLKSLPRPTYPILVQKLLWINQKSFPYLPI